jgi:hypothetical protein
MIYACACVLLFVKAGMSYGFGPFCGIMLKNALMVFLYVPEQCLYNNIAVKLLLLLNCGIYICGFICH